MNQHPLQHKIVETKTAYISPKLGISFSKSPHPHLSTHNCSTLPGMCSPRENPIPPASTKKGLVESLRLHNLILRKCSKIPQPSHSPPKKQLDESASNPKKSLAFAPPKNTITNANQFLSDSFQANSWGILCVFLWCKQVGGDHSDIEKG